MALNSNALVNLADLQVFLNDTTRDTELERLINVASQRIEKFCRRKLVETTHTEYHDGRRTRKLLLREYPIISVTTVKIDGSSQFAAGTEYDLANIAIYELNNLIIRTNSSNWPKGYRNIEVVYLAGEGDLGAGTIPSDLQNACLETCAWMDQQNNDRRLGQIQKSKLGESVSFSQGMPKWIKEQLEEYERREFAVTNSPIPNS